ncbi:poly(A)-specific ribonuclease PARN-like isoform X1 [Anopheles aquasalis]|uniref:poly(A)-specific ribonuclease PARN-like isoform X1 n=1 Tax=Anopheles aquasalis TaxID=42839 RepID=UPI00215A21DF|nr:poly(A)-specific ribonuclease PARN-like isoform X1 [Anopheles aquasalis]
MEITAKNFAEQLPEIRKAIQEASFFAIDCEFTGLASDRLIFPFDTPEEVYQKTVEANTQYIIVQFGLCAFRVEPAANGDDDESAPTEPRLTYKCYNFYCYPKGRTHIFSCQGESLRFLADHGFDFNKLFREGLSFATEAEAERLRSDLKERQANRAAALQAAADGTADDAEPADVNMVPVPAEHQEQIDETAAKIEAFLQSDDTELIVDNCNGFQRKLIYQMIEHKYQQRISTSTITLENNHKCIKVERKRTAEKDQEIEQKRVAQENEDLQTTIGLSVVLQELSKARKLVIGHNIFLDLLYTIRQFFKPLPTDFKEFKKLTKEIFPLLLDTKYLCTNAEIKVNVNSSILAHVYEAVSKAPFSIPKVQSGMPEHGYCVEEQKEHEAGYDAYLTGLCFLGLASRFNMDLQNLTKDSTLKQYLNKIFIARLLDNNYINLNGKEPTHSREHIFYVTFPESWRTGDIIGKFKPFGSVHINWLNNTSAFVSLHNRIASSSVLKTIGYHPGFAVHSFAQFTQMKLQRLGFKRRRNDSASAGKQGATSAGATAGTKRTATSDDTNAKKEAKEKGEALDNEEDERASDGDEQEANDEDTGADGWRTVKRARTTFATNDDW